MPNERNPAPVAHPTFSPNEKIPLYYNDIENHILLSNDENIKKNSRINEYTIFSRFEKIATNQGAIKAYKHFLINGASFAKELSRACNYSLATAYRAIESLKEMDLITPLTILSLRKAAGPSPTLYGLYDSTKEEEIKAGNRYLKTKRKTYRQVQEIVQLSLREAENQEIQFQKICFIAKKHNNKNFHFLDIAEQAELELKELNIKVWR